MLRFKSRIELSFETAGVSEHPCLSSALVLYLVSKGKAEGALIEVEDHSIWSILGCLERERAGAEREVVKLGMSPFGCSWTEDVKRLTQGELSVVLLLRSSAS